MRPRLTMHDAGHGRAPDAEDLGDGLVRLTSRHAVADVQHLRSVQLLEAPRLVAALADRVADVVALRARRQMGRIHTARGVARVHDDLSRRHGLLMRDFPREDVRADSEQAEMDLYVPAVDRSTLYQPALGLFDRPRVTLLAEGCDLLGRQVVVVDGAESTVRRSSTRRGWGR